MMKMEDIILIQIANSIKGILTNSESLQAFLLMVKGGKS